MMLSGAHATVSARQMADLTQKHLSHYLGSPGSKEWWREFREEVELPPQITAVVNAATGESGQRRDPSNGETR